MKIEKVSAEFAVDLIELVNSCKGIKYNKKVKIKTKTGKDMSYEYITLDKIYACVKANNNFALLEPLGTNEAGQPALQIVLIHKSGEAITSDYYTLRLPSSGSKQDEGSAITYTKRYALGSFLGISTDGDNDAKGVEITDWRQELIKLCKEKGWDMNEIARKYNTSKNTTQDEFKDIVTDLTADVIEQDEPKDAKTVSMSEI